MTARLTLVGKLPGGWDVHGKSGTGFQRKAGTEGPDLGHQIGWLVGWATKGARTVVFAYATRDEKRKSTRAGVRAKAQFLGALPGLFAAPGTATR